jgi:hypothetical protein
VRQPGALPDGLKFGRVTTRLVIIGAVWIVYAAGTLNVSDAATRPLAIADVGSPSGLTSYIRARHIRIEHAPPTEPRPSALLKFDVFNGGLLTLETVTLRISVSEKPDSNHPLIPGRVLVRPLTIRATAELEPGQTLDYEVLLRNLDPDCNCVARIDVLAAPPSAIVGDGTL